MASADTRQRRRERIDRERQRKRQQRDSALPVFKAVGIDAAVRQMEPWLRDFVYRFRRVKFRPILAPDAAKLENCILLAERLRELADDTMVELPNGARIS